MPNTPEPVARRKLSHEVAGRLVAAIASGTYGPGDHLPSERELMVHYGVGRPAVREAMHSLHEQGLIRIAHGERARVLAPTPGSVVQGASAAMMQLLSTDPGGLDDLKEARALFEVGLARLAATRAGPDGIAALRAALADCRAKRGTGAAFVSADMAFHRVIAGLSGNALIAAVAGGLLDWIARFKRDMVSVRGADRITLSEHERIADAIAAGDADAAAAAMSDHLQRANRLYAQLRG